MQENIFRDMMNKAEKKDSLRNKEVGKMSKDTKTTMFGIGALITFGIIAYSIYRLDRYDSGYRG